MDRAARVEVAGHLSVFVDKNEMMNMSEKKFDPRKADKLLTEKRVDKKPYELIDRLGVSESDAIADLGAGNGFFTIPLAKVSKQDVYVVDIEPQMLDLLKYRVDQENLDHIQYVTSDLEYRTR